MKESREEIQELLDTKDSNNFKKATLLQAFEAQIRDETWTSTHRGTPNAKQRIIHQQIFSDFAQNSKKALQIHWNQTDKNKIVDSSFVVVL